MSDFRLAKDSRPVVSYIKFDEIIFFNNLWGTPLRARAPPPPPPPRQNVVTEIPFIPTPPPLQLLYHFHCILHDELLLSIVLNCRYMTAKIWKKILDRSLCLRTHMIALLYRGTVSIVLPPPPPTHTANSFLSAYTVHSCDRPYLIFCPIKLPEKSIHLNFSISM